MPVWTVEYDEVTTTPVTAEVEAVDEETARAFVEGGEHETEVRHTLKSSVLRRVVQHARIKKED